MSDVFSEIESTPLPDPTPAPDVTPNPQPHAPSVFDEIEAQPTPQQGMAAGRDASAGMSPAKAATTAAVANRLRVQPQAVAGNPEQAAQGASAALDAASDNDIAARHPVLAKWLAEGTNAAIARGDIANLRALSTQVQSINPSFDYRPDLPLLDGIQISILRADAKFGRTLLAGPAWLQDESRKILGITSAPTPGTPLSMLYGVQDLQQSLQRQRDEWYRPSAVRDLVTNTVGGLVADPLTTVLLPAAGAQLAIRGSMALGEAANAARAITGAAAVQGLTSSAQTVVDDATRERQTQQSGQQLADRANEAVQGALGFFFGKIGQQIPVLRAIGASPFTTKPVAELGEDIVRQAVIGGSQNAASGSADTVLHEGRLPTAGELAALYASGAIPGGLMAAGNVHEALQAEQALKQIRNGESLSFAGKLHDLIQTAQASQAAQHGPEQVAALIDQLAAAHGVGSVYLQSADWQDHFLAKGMDPVAEAQRAGLYDEYVQARGLGGDMQVPLRTAVGLGVDSDNPAAFAAKVRQHAMAPNGVEAAQFFQAPDPEAVERNKALAGEQIAAAEAEQPPSQSLAQRLEAQAIAAGRSPEEAKTFADLHARFFQRLADRFNGEREEKGGPEVSADDIAQQFPLEVRRVIDASLREQIENGALPAMLDRLRSEGPTDAAHHAARDALARLGFDATTHTNDEILSGLSAHGAEQRATGHVANGHPVVLADVPYAGGTSQDGKTVYIDRRIPRYHDFTTKDGKTVRLDLHQMIAEHEIAEKTRLDRGESYSRAHGEAEHIEDAEVDHQGISHADYEAVLKPYIDQAKAQAKPEHIPADLETKPYQDMGEEHLIKGAAGPAFDQRVNAEGIRLTDPEALRLRAEAEKRGELAPVSPDEETGKFPAVQRQQETRGSFQGGERGSLIRLFDGANQSTLLHEGAHYFLDVLSKLSGRDGAPKALVDDFAKLIEWAGYGDRATMERMNAELATLQAKPDPSAADRTRMAELAEPHEKVARGFESYLREGRAPAPGLRRAFARMKTWLVKIYKDAKELGVNLTDDVRGVFDRLLASDREIERAKARVADEPAFLDQAASGMSDRDWKAYQAAHEDLRRQQQERLDRDVLRHEQEAQKEHADAVRGEIRDRVADEVGRERVHDSIRQLQDGTTWDGRELPEPLKILRRDAERLLTPEEMKQLPGPGREKNRGRSILTPDTDKGLQADDVAQRLGYGSGLDMLKDFIAAPDRKQEIERRTDAAMAERFPDLMRDQGALEQAADQAVHEPDARAAVLEMERRQLAKLLTAEQAKARDEAQRQELAGEREKADAKTDRQAGRVVDALGRQALRQSASRDERQAMRVAASAMLQDAKIQTIDPDRYLAAERKAAIAVAKAIGQKDYATALTQKRAQMMNAELARAAHEAQESIGRKRRDLVKAASNERYRSAIAKAGGLEFTVTRPDGTTQVFTGSTAQEEARAEAVRTGGTFDRTSGYLEQMDALLERVDLKERSDKSLAARQSLRDFLGKIQSQTTPDGERIPSGVFADIPQSVIDDIRKPNLAEMTLRDFDDLHRAVVGIAAMAKQVNTLLKSTRAERMDDAAQVLIDQVTATGKKSFTGPVASAIANAVATWKAGSDGTTGGKLTAPLRALGNFFDSLIQVPRLHYEMDGFKDNGPIQRLLGFPAIEASDRELVYRAKAKAEMQEAFKEWGKSDGHVRERVDGITKGDGQPWFMTRLDRIVTLMHYGNVEGRQRLRDLNHWGDAEVHRIVDSLDAKDIAFANRMVDLLSSHWSEAKALAEKYNGEAPPKVEAVPVDLPNGSYQGGYQHIYYDGESVSSLEQMAQQLRTEGMIGGGYARPTTPHGYLKERSSTVKDRVLSLSAENWARSLNEVIHDITHRDVVCDQMRLINRKDVREAIIGSYGYGAWKQMVNQTLGMAQGNKPAVTALSKVAEYARLSMNYSKRAFNPAYALIQEAGMVQAMARVKPQYIAAANAQLWSGPLCMDHTAHWIAEQSPSMKYRAQTRDALIQNGMDENTLGSSARKFLDGVGMTMVTKVWEHLDNVIWKAAYDQHMAEGASHDDAVKVATQIVESEMGSTKQKDLSEVQRWKAINLLTANMTWSIANWNAIAREWNRGTSTFLRYGQGGWGQMARGLGALGALTVIGPMLWDWLEDVTKGAPTDSWTTQKGLAKHAVQAIGYSASTGIPIVRDIEPGIVEGKPHEGTTGLQWLTAIQRLGPALHARQYDAKTGKAVAGAVGTFLPLPTAALFNAMDGYKEAQRHGDSFPATVWKMMMGPAPKK